MQRFTARGGWWVVAQIALFVLLGMLWWTWDGHWGRPAVVAGWAAAGAGALQGLWGLLALGGNLTPYPSPKHGAELIERGPYRLVRHPIYGGLVMGAAGISLADGNAGGLTVALGLLVLFVGKSEFEEERLLARFPAYEGYRHRVRWRLIPFVV
jgi:protein-S-isoprenylcysteine O-methyltransferase Ste14